MEIPVTPIPTLMRTVTWRRCFPIETADPSAISRAGALGPALAESSRYYALEY